MRVPVIMDDLSSAIPDKDTTIGFMLAAQKLGHTVDYAQISDLFIENGHGGVRARTVRLSLDDSPFYALEKVCVSELALTTRFGCAKIHLSTERICMRPMC